MRPELKSGDVLAAEKKAVILDVANKAETNGWGRLRTPNEATHSLLKPNNGLGGLRDVAGQLKGGRGISFPSLMYEIDRQMTETLETERLQRLISQSPDYSASIASGFQNAFNVGRESQDLSEKMIDRSRAVATLIGKAIAWEEVRRDNPELRSKPNIFLAMLRLYAEGAVNVTTIFQQDPETGLGKEMFTADFPVIVDGVSQLLCHLEKSKQATLFHGWDEEHDNSMMPEKPTQVKPPQTTISAETTVEVILYSTNPGIADGETDILSPEELKVELARRIEFQNNRRHNRTAAQREEQI